jgi:hypothetical protein
MVIVDTAFFRYSAHQSMRACGHQGSSNFAKTLDLAQPPPSLLQFQTIYVRVHHITDFSVPSGSETCRIGELKDAHDSAPPVEIKDISNLGFRMTNELVRDGRQTAELHPASAIHDASPVSGAGESDGT